MKRVVTCGLTAQYNLGCPSILHGIFELLTEIYGEGFELVNLQIGNVVPSAVADMPFQTFAITDFNAKNMLLELYGLKRMSSESGQLAEALDKVRRADVVIDLFGICFCDNFAAPEWRGILSRVRIMLRFPFSLYAKRRGILSIKNAASFGPITSKYNRELALYSSLHAFDRMIAREEKSWDALQNCGVKNCVRVSPDVANLMRFEKRKLGEKPVIGISTSHQIVRQWKSAEDYVTCVAALCCHINQTINADISLIPNETNPKTIYNDIDVSEDILEKLSAMGGHASILNTTTMTGLEQKNYIASCEVVVASRYHSCVAALSSGVPLLSIGWHNKYEELLCWYGQEQWLLSENDCNIDKLISTFDAFWEARTHNRETIASNYPAVRAAVVSAGREMLGAETEDLNG